MPYFDDTLALILEEHTLTDFKASVAVVQSGDRWLLGLSTADDDRNNTWCFPGGGIKRGEGPEKAATRECWEETGIKARAVGEPFAMPGKKHVCFVHCRANRHQKFDNNSEFSGLGFFTKQEMRRLKLYPNVLKLIDRVR